MSGINFIRKNLAVCGIADIGRPETFLGYGFKAQLQCAEGFDSWLADYVEVKPLPFDDEAPVPESIFEEALEWLSGQWDQGKKILISCTSGESRSVSMAIGLLHIKEKYNFLTIAKEVCSRIRGAYPHPAVLVSVANHLDVQVEFDELKDLYLSIKLQPPFPWSDELLKNSLKPTEDFSMNANKQFLLSNRHLFEGKEAIYREGEGFSRVRIHDIDITDTVGTALVDLIPTPGLLNTRPAIWQIGSRWDSFGVDKDGWRMPYLSIGVYFGKNLLKAVVDLCSNLPADEYSSEHSTAIIGVLSDFINGRRTV